MTFKIGLHGVVSARASLYENQYIKIDYAEISNSGVDCWEAGRGKKEEMFSRYLRGWEREIAIIRSSDK